jgi:hypothetical protein
MLVDNIKYSKTTCNTMATINMEVLKGHELIDKIDEITQVLIKKGARGYAKIIVSEYVFNYLQKNFRQDLVEIIPFDIIPTFPDEHQETTVGVLNGKWAINILPAIEIDYLHCSMFICVGTTQPENTAYLALIGLENIHEQII